MTTVGWPDGAATSAVAIPLRACGIHARANHYYHGIMTKAGTEGGKKAPHIARYAARQLSPRLL